jgi:D-alanyl-lipoteichoic acid acyltransferase DltB (MBOAT superfamily)
VTLLPSLVFVLGAVLIAWLLPARMRLGAIVVASLLAVFWLQPGLPIRSLDFWIPTASVLLVIIVWTTTQPTILETAVQRKSLLQAGGLIGGSLLLLSLTRYLGGVCCLSASRPPQIGQVFLFVAAGLALASLPILLPRQRRLFSLSAISLILALFLVLKSPVLLQAASQALRGLTGQPVELANPQDISWLGFSFIAFRLLHALLDFRAGRLPAYRLDQFVAYVLFFPSLPAGPIDRSQHFIGQLDNPKGFPAANLSAGLERIVWGLFKKFVLADSLALAALNSQSATQVESTLWTWLLVYAYALRIYFDFSAYTDLALGIGKILGLNLPENFDRPYLKQNLTAFWNSWHITLAQWFRAYFFNPLTRTLRSQARSLPVWGIILLAQVSTMVLIGLWHGINWNFAIWGAWHGLGLFIHNRWSEWSRSRLGFFETHPSWQRAASGAGWLLTFHYVALGWVWFALPSVQLSSRVFQKLAGF